MANYFKNKKVLIMGLGLLGGGIASAKWFVKQRALVTVTDTKSGKELLSSIRKLGIAAKKIKFTLGRHNEKDFTTNDYIVVNPGVPRENRFLKIARHEEKKLINDASVFFDTVQNPVIAVSGTRGKTTTVNWIYHFLKSKYSHTVMGGNSSDKPLLMLTDTLKDKKTPVTVELSSWQLELFPQTSHGADIAIITNIYSDHLNRYVSIKDYAQAKANIFKNQTKNQKLILNADNEWTPFFLRQKPQSKIYLFSLKNRKDNGIFIGDKGIFIRDGGDIHFLLNKKETDVFLKKWGSHNLANLLPAALASHLQKIPINLIRKRIKTLPVISYRQEIIKKTKILTVINDSTATSPDATIAALKRFEEKNKKIILITGGTDKNLDFNAWARVVRKNIQSQNLFLLNGTATKKMIIELQKINYFKQSSIQIFESLPEILKTIKKNLKPKTYNLKPIIIFSPSSASFEKFKNEFDRGEKFNIYFKKLFFG